MKNCKNIEYSLPLYSENLLSESERLVVEEHLKSCSACAKTLLQLQRSGMIVQELKDVEPPSWFREKIMAKLREEADKKSFAQKWFYPLRIKIPMQIMAAIIIAVLSVYIYRAGDEQMKAVLPGSPQPVTESKQEPPAETAKAKKVAPVPVAEKKAVTTGAVEKDKMSEEVSSGGSGPKMRVRGNMVAATTDKSLSMKSDFAAAKEEKKYSEPQDLPVAPQRYSAGQESVRERSMEDSSSSGAAKKSKMFKAAAPAAPSSMAASVSIQTQASITMLVADVNNATVEAEKILAKYGARKIIKQLLYGKTILKAELSAEIGRAHV
jgi:hypothetical protein